MKTQHPSHIHLRHVVVASVLAFLVLSAAPYAAGDVDFKKDILPLLQDHCIDCHGPETAESNLRLDSPTNALRGGDSGEPTIVPGNSAASYLMGKVKHSSTDERMPPDTAPLSRTQIDLLAKWIDDQENWSQAKSELSQTTIDHWSFQPLSRPDVPKSSDVSLQPIDAFVQQKLWDTGIGKSPRASRRVLARRAYLVMHGLPPTLEQLDGFERDDSPTAWASLVNQLLDSPRFGEHFAVSWLDLVRFGETTGFETNRERPNAWHYRDWVIDAFNQDKPYDQFIIEQLAGDAVGQHIGTGFLVGGPNDIVKGQDPKLGLMQRQDELADIINTTGTTFLGLTLGCARCHNHKFDPVSQTDYYALQAVFAGVKHGDKTIPPTEKQRTKTAKLTANLAAQRAELTEFIQSHSAVATKPLLPPVNAKLNIETFKNLTAKFVRFSINNTNVSEPCIDELEVFSGDTNVALASSGAIASSSGDFVHPLHKLAHINDGQFGNPKSWISAKKSGGWVQIEFTKPTKVDRIVWARDRNGEYADRLAIDYKIETSLDGQAWSTVASSSDRLPFAKTKTNVPTFDLTALPPEKTKIAASKLERINTVSAQLTKLSKSTTVYAGRFAQPGPTHRLYRGDPSSPREAVSPAAIESLAGRSAIPVSLSANSPEQDRRLAIAKWIADKQNPLTARVIVNRIWQFHFGTGIVDTPSDFGGNGTTPTHPQLLDWLAGELLSNDWSLKHIHRLILLSETWQQTSKPNATGMSQDADTRLLWRFPPRRLSAEAIRDSILAATGKLDTRIGGSGFSAFEIQPENVRHYFPKKDFGPADWRRMVYMTRVRQERDAVFGVFDCPDFNQVVPKRSQSTTPLQALNLLNSRFVTQQSEFLVERLGAEATTDEAKVTLAYQLCFGRAANTQEAKAAIAFIQETSWQQFGRAMLNANEFVFIP